MSEFIHVETEIGSDGTVAPKSFTWRDRHYPILEVGRQGEVQGERRVLVMIEGEQVFELALDLATGAWRIRRRPEDFGPTKRRV